MPKTCYRLRDTRMICGVCAGVAEYFNIDVSLVRIVWGVLAFSGLPTVVYLVASCVLPEK